MSYYNQYRPARQRLFPPAVLNLIIINAIMFFAKILAAGRSMDIDVYLDLHHPYTNDFHWYQYITSMFMHADASHILFNMLGLWMFGAMLENSMGVKRFIIFYLVCGVGASMIYQVWQTFDQVKMLNEYGDGWALLKAHPPMGSLLGASGAVYGVMMGSALLFPNTEMYMIGFMGFPIKLKWVALIYGGGELLRAWQADPTDNIAHFAHIGGMIFGFLMIKIFSLSRSNFY
ncbi:MAG: rhomboid family intramembrane serine protease [Bacteroidetes bacterium]|nr:rhomboid family intramembrane serine protease [Bacteroidota bacterium]